MACEPAPGGRTPQLAAGANLATGRAATMVVQRTCMQQALLLHGLALFSLPHEKYDVRLFKLLGRSTFDEIGLERRIFVANGLALLVGLRVPPRLCFIHVVELDYSNARRRRAL